MMLGWNSGPGNCSTLDLYSDVVFYFGRNPRFTLFKFPSDCGGLDDLLCGTLGVHINLVYNLKLYNAFCHGLLYVGSVS